MGCSRLTWLLLALSLLPQARARAQGTSSVQLPQKQITLGELESLLFSSYVPGSTNVQATKDVRNIRAETVKIPPDRHKLEALAGQLINHLVILTEDAKHIVNDKSLWELPKTDPSGPVAGAKWSFPKAQYAIVSLKLIGGSNIAEPGRTRDQLRQDFQRAIFGAIHAACPDIVLNGTGQKQPSVASNQPGNAIDDPPARPASGLGGRGQQQLQQGQQPLSAGEETPLDTAIKQAQNIDALAPAALDNHGFGRDNIHIATTLKDIKALLMAEKLLNTAAGQEMAKAALANVKKDMAEKLKGEHFGSPQVDALWLPRIKDAEYLADEAVQTIDSIGKAGQSGKLITATDARIGLEAVIQGRQNEPNGLTTVAKGELMQIALENRIDMDKHVGGSQEIQDVFVKGLAGGGYDMENLIAIAARDIESGTPNNGPANPRQNLGKGFLDVMKGAIESSRWKIAGGEPTSGPQVPEQRKQ